MYRFNVELSDQSYQVSWLDLVADEEDKNEAKAKKNLKGSKSMMGGSLDPYASDDDDQLKVWDKRFLWQCKCDIWQRLTWNQQTTPVSSLLLSWTLHLQALARKYEQKYGGAAEKIKKKKKAQKVRLTTVGVAEVSTV